MKKIVSLGLAIVLSMSLTSMVFAGNAGVKNEKPKSVQATTVVSKEALKYYAKKYKTYDEVIAAARNNGAVVNFLDNEPAEAIAYNSVEEFAAVLDPDGFFKASQDGGIVENHDHNHDDDSLIVPFGDPGADYTVQSHHKSDSTSITDGVGLFWTLNWTDYHWYDGLITNQTKTSISAYTGLSGVTFGSTWTQAFCNAVDNNVNSYNVQYGGTKTVTLSGPVGPISSSTNHMGNVTVSAPTGW